MMTEEERDRGEDWPLALAELYRDQYGHMVRLAHFLTGSNAVAEELVQDVFVRLWRRGDIAAHPLAYLRQSVVNACRSQRRRWAVERRLPTEPALLVDPPTDALRDVLASLPYRQRAAVVLRFYEDLRDDEIATVLGCRTGTVKSLVHRGLTQLRRVIEP